MKNFSILHLSGYAAFGLLTACLAQQWFGDHAPYRANLGDNTDAWQQTQYERQQASSESAKLALLRADNQKEIARQAQLRTDRTHKEEAWKAFYSKPAQCEFPSTDLLFAACADDFIRAKAQFDKQYAKQAPMSPFQSTLALSDFPHDGQ